MTPTAVRDAGGPVIGVLGGMGPAATVDFFRRIVAATPADRDQDHLHLVIDDDPSVPDRTAALLDGGPDPTPTLMEMARRVAVAGAQILVAPCNTASAFLDPAARAAGVPLLRWNAAVVRLLAARYPTGTTVGILATAGTARTGLYQEYLVGAGLRAWIPDAAVQAAVSDLIRQRKAGRAQQNLVPDLRAAVDAARTAGADIVLLACTELSDIGAVATDLDAVDAMDLVVERLLDLVAVYRHGAGEGAWPPAAPDIVMPL